VNGTHTREQEGTGIGLAHSKELAELHRGKIEVESEEGKGTTFTICFPLGKAHLKPEEIGNTEYEKGQEQEKEMMIQRFEDIVKRKDEFSVDVDLEKQPAQPTLLLVEDNPDVRNYISMILGNEYRIFEAKDGEEGLDKAFECIPDLIISDVMMPKMDGFQLCRQLKTDFRTSHIPVIMLTAKATMQDKINGLEIGADEYIMKPFDAEELRARIKNLLEQRKRLHEHFNKYGFADTERKNITSADQKFLTKVVSIIDENISDTSFGVEVLAEKLAVSQSLLYKKIISLTGTSPSELIKKLRLNKAAKLIESNTGNISEIALEVGFNNPAYFTECFKKQFGVAPSQYHKM
jgi:YesN/AraC family two-component response regulator